MAVDKKRVLFIVNPVSGVNQSRKSMLADVVAARFDPELFEWEIRLSESAVHVQKLSREATAAGVDIIVAVGGDGTINEIAQVLVDSSAVLGIIPAGSGNGLAHFLKIPFKLEEALNLIKNGEAMCIDTIQLNDRIAVSIAGMGFDARIARQFALDNHRGFFTYFKIAVKEYITFRPRLFQVITNNFIIKERAILLSIANSNQFGYNTFIAPKASITDGLADITIVKKIPYSKILRTVVLLFTHKIDKSLYVNTYKADQFTVIRETGKYVNIDGEPFKMDKEVHVKVKLLFSNRCFQEDDQVQLLPRSH